MKKTRVCFLLVFLCGISVIYSDLVKADSAIGGCIASWDFDEAGGDVAIDDTGNGYDAELKNGASRSDDGALSLDGIDDYVETPFVLNPADGPFSVFAWVKREGTQKSIICQADGEGFGEAWLYVSESGALGTSLGGIDLLSSSILTDNMWHQVGFVWGGEKRALYIDGKVAAGDYNHVVTMGAADGGLYIGAYKELESDYYWQGEIDDVCIYNRALTASEIENVVIKQDIMGWSGLYMPDGSESRPYLIEDFRDFQLFATNSLFWKEGVHVKLACDFDLSGYELTNSVIAQNYAVEFGPRPLPEEYEYVTYEGVFDGNGHVISNMNILNTNTYYGDPWSGIVDIPSIGLFSDLGDSAVVKNLYIRDSGITSYSGDIGILAGVSSGRIENCHVIDSTLINYGDSAGGLVGESNGIITRCSSEDVYIISFASGFSSSFTDRVGTGGLVGVVVGPQYGPGEISYTFATGEIYGISNIGGLLGYSYLSDISNCYSKCDVNGSSIAGGFIGYMSNGLIDKCYYAGEVMTSEASNTGVTGVLCSFYGGGQEGDITNSFWDREAANNMDYPYWEFSNLPKGLTTSEMYDSANYIAEGWNFDPMAEGIYWIEQEGGYPRLSWEVNLSYDRMPIAEVFEGETSVVQLTILSQVDNSWELTGFENCKWIKSVTPESGTITGFGRAIIEIEVDSDGLGVGGYGCVLQCNSTGRLEFAVPVIMNVNERIDLVEFSQMANFWLQDGSSDDKSYRDLNWNWDDRLDIGDLAILAENWLGKYKYISSDLLLNWEFDTDQDYLTLDSSGNNFNGILRNGPERLDVGSMKFDGVDDYITSEYILDPSDGPFSVCAWVKGGGLVNVLMSQGDEVGRGRAWLYIDERGKLASELSGDYIEADVSWDSSEWHHVVLVWDGSRRYLAIDGEQVARDSLPIGNLEYCKGRMYLGAYKDLEEEYFWNGQIDDVRIYRHALIAEEVQEIMNLRTNNASMGSAFYGDFEVVES